MQDESPAPAEDREVARLRELASFVVLDTPSEESFDELVALASRLCGTSAAMVSLVDADRQWVKARVGTELAGGPREQSFCLHALDGPQLLEVPDARLDPRCAAYPVVTGEPFVRLYAGAPLVTSAGHVLGTLCVLDPVPRALLPQQRADLQLLARQVVRLLETRRQAAALAAQVQARLSATARARAQKRVLDAVLAHTDVLVHAKDLAGRFVLVNHALDAVTRVDGGLLGLRDHDLLPAAGVDEHRRDDVPTAELNERQEFIEDLVHPDGSVHTYRSTRFPLLGEDGVVEGTAGVSTDVTELVAARTAHAESEQRWRALVEHSPVAVAVIGADARFRYANPRAVALYGARDVSQVTGRPAADFVSTGDEVATALLFHGVLNGGGPVLAHRWILRQLGGARLTVEVNAVRVLHLGEPAVQVELRDVTAAAAAEQSVRASERRFHAIFDDSPVAMALSDSDGLLVEVNAALGRLLATDPATLVGRRAEELAHPDDRVLLAGAGHDEAGSPDGAHRRELRLLRPDGSVCWVWVTTSPTPGPGGRVFTLLVAQDVTARRAAEAALRGSEAELAAIAAVVRCVQSGADPRPVVVESVRQLAGASTVSMMEAFDEETLVVTGSVGVSDALGLRVALSATSMTAHVWRTGQPVFLADAADDPRVNGFLLALDGTVSALWQPVVVEGAVHAVLNVTWRQRVDDPGGRAVRAVQVIADEAGTSLQATRLRRELERSASTDPLTGSLNRRAWDDRLVELAAAALRTGAPLAVAVVDLDHFKAFNDARGHSAGDDVLREFADRARASLRRGDVFARWGGEEFVLALPDADPEQAAQVLERVRASVPGGLTCSIGHTTWDPAEDVTDGVARADAALYDAKHSGRDRLVLRPAPGTAVR